MKSDFRAQCALTTEIRRQCQALLAVLFFTSTLLILNPAYANQDRESILILHSKSNEFKKLANLLKEEWIYSDFKSSIAVHAIELSNDFDIATVAQSLAKNRRTMIIVIGNTAAVQYIKVQRALAQHNRPQPPVLLFYCLYADELLKYLKNASAIRFEIPVVTSLVRLRQVLSDSLVNVGVVYRKWNKDFIERNAALAEQEGFQIHHIIVDEKDPLTPQLNAGIHKLKKLNVGAIWLTGDNELVNVETLAKSWIPRLKDHPISILTSLPNLAETPLGFANASVATEEKSLVLQVVDKVIDTIENDWTFNGATIVEPVSIDFHFNLSISEEKGIPFERDALMYMNTITE